MLQQVAQLAPPAPQDRGSVTAEAMAAGGVSQAGGFDFTAMLAQAEAQEQVIPTGEIAPAEIATENGTSGPTAGVAAGFVPVMAAPIRQHEAVQAAGQAGADVSDGIPLPDDKLGENQVDLINAPLPDPDSAAPESAALLPAMATRQAGSVSLPTPGELPDPENAAPEPAALLPAMAMQQPGSASLLALSGAAQPGTGPEQPAISPPGLLPQEEVPPSDLSPVAAGLTAMGRDTVPAAPAALAVKLPPGDLAGTDGSAAAWASDPHPEGGEHAAPEGPAEDAETASVVRLEPPVAQPTGAAPTLMAGPLLPEGRGLSMPVDPSMAGAGLLPGHVGPGLSSYPTAAGLALPYQRLFQSQLSAQVAPAVLTMGVSPGADGGPGRLTLAIRPAELGTLQIIAERTEDKTARIAVLAERPETLQLLVRDAPTLEAALRAAGVGEDGGLSLTFGLASQGEGDPAGDSRGEARGDAGRGDGAAPKPSVIAAAQVMARTSLVDLSL